MFHGSISPEIARSIQVLRQRIEQANIPPSILDETLNLATWNIREFGARRKRRRRSDAAIHMIAEILYQFDLIAITEVRDDLTDLYRALEILGPHWRAIFSDFNTDRAGNRERIAYVYDERAAKFTGLAAEADPPRRRNPATGEYEPTITWWRSPFMASFSAGNFDFVLLTAHIRWGRGPTARLKPLRQLAAWVDKRSKEKHIVDKDIIVLGDFNIPDVPGELYDAVASMGLSIPDALRGTDHGTNLARDKRYDQILHYRRHTDTFTDIGGALDFYLDDWRALFPEEHYPDMSKADFTYELSDHLPLWVQVDTWTDDEELDQFLSRH